jgi:hypothetical protein
MAMQAKHVPEAPILKFLSELNQRSGTWFQGYDNSVPVPKGTPDRVIIAKMRSLIKRGLVTGCTCGCRGNYEITDKGRKESHG